MANTPQKSDSGSSSVSGKLNQRDYWPSSMGILILKSEKTDDVRRLIDLLEVDLKETNLLPPREHFSSPCGHIENMAETSLIERNAALEELLVHTRDVQDAQPLFSREVTHRVYPQIC